jgi:quercetin 2,3-dioxygenase
MSAGTGILHSERNDRVPLEDDVHFVQMWVVPDSERIEPGYEQLDIGSELSSGGLVVVASGMPKHTDDKAISIRQRHAALHAGRVEPGRHVAVPVAPLAHVYLARGSARLEDGSMLNTGDAARITGSDGQRLTAGPDGAEVLIWEMHATIAA